MCQATLSAVLMAASSLPLAAQGEAVQRADIVVHLDQPTHRISPLLYGVFFEEINHAGEGGLWAQLLRNPTFEEPGTEGDPLPGWSVTTRNADGSDAPSLVPPQARLSAAAQLPANPATPRHARIDVLAHAWLVNRGHFGVPIRSGEEYVFSAVVKQRKWSGLPDAFTFTVVDERGGVVLQPAEDSREDFFARLGETKQAVDGEWREFTFRAKAIGTTTAGELRIGLFGDNEFAVDTVTLRPVKTWKGHGLRQDLGELLAALRPAFLRFPGGCYVEGGDRLADAFRWQKSLGPLAERPGHKNANWGYWTSTGLGFHEYLQLCEDLGAVPMYVANCGLSHREAVPMDQLQPWIDETLAAIEYANGDATTKWGARRAANGHKAPFGLRYLEIGNENGMFGAFGGTKAIYTERYETFRKAIAAAYPEVVTIANVRVDAPMQVVDDHFYQSSAWFWQNADRYAKPAAGDPQIYVGEYAVTWQPGVTGNLRAALGEAAFLLGLQRAGPHVVMTSYAPLFVHVKDRKWNPDLIQFDGLRSCGTPSYHVQALLAQNRPDENLKCVSPDTRSGPGRGSIGFGTWNTQAEFREVTVEVDGQVVHRSDFTGETTGWRAQAGKWSVVEGSWRQADEGEMRWSWLDVAPLREAGDCVVRCKARKLGGREGFLVMFHTRGADEWTWWNVGGWNNREHGIERTQQGSKLGVGARVRGGVETGRWYDVRIECTGDRIRTFLDGAQVHDVVDQGVPDFAVAAGRCGDGTLVIEAVNGSNATREYTVQLGGAPATARSATITVLTAPSLDAENTLDAPGVVAPSVEIRAIGSERFVHSFAPRSLTVLRLATK